jgi:hypothetical protein
VAPAGRGRTLPPVPARRPSARALRRDERSSLGKRTGYKRCNTKYDTPRCGAPKRPACCGGCFEADVLGAVERAQGGGPAPGRAPRFSHLGLWRGDGVRLTNCCIPCESRRALQAPVATVAGIGAW